MLISYTSDEFPDAYIPTVFDNYQMNVDVGGRSYNVGLWDTAGQEDYDKFRSLSYSDTDCFIICFAVTSPNSFDNVKTKWIPEIKRYSKTSPFIIVGTKADLRGDALEKDRLEANGQKMVDSEDAKTFALSVGAKEYLECSALSQKGLKVVFDRAIHHSIVKPNQDACCTLQ